MSIGRHRRGLLFVTAAAAMIAASAFAAEVAREWRSRAPGRPTSSNLAEVAAGMSEGEVVALLGPPDEAARRPDGSATLSWREQRSPFTAQRMPTTIAHVPFRDGRTSGTPYSL